MSIDYKSWYENAKTELQKLQREQAELDLLRVERDKQIAALIKTMNAIAPLIGEEPMPAADGKEAPTAGMTDCIRTILAQADEPLSAAEIRDRLSAMGFDMKSYSNALATVHTILRRLAEAVEVEPLKLNVPLPGGKKFAITAGKSFTLGKNTRGVIGAVGPTRYRAKVAPNT